MKITLVDGDEWRGLYLDNDLVYQEDRIDERFLLQLLSERGLIDFERKALDEDWLYERGVLPDSLEEVKLADED